MPATIAANFGILSPRLNPPTRAARGVVIWGAAIALFIALLSQGFVRMGVGAWAVGIAYVLYDTALLVFTASRTRAITASLSSPPAIAQPTLGVVIAAFNEAPVLEATITAMLAQNEPPDLVVVADDGSDDGTGEIMQTRFALAPPALETLSAASMVAPGVHWLRLPRGGKARALNAAIPLVDTAVLVTVDADTLLAPGALSAMRSAFAIEPALAAATGVLRPVCAPTVSGRVFQFFQGYEYVRNFLSRYAWMQASGLLLISGAFAGFRRNALIQVGGFDPECLVEDYEVIHRLHRFGVDHRLGWTVRVVGDAFATTDSPADLMTFLRQRRRWFAGFLQTQLWNRDMIGNPRYGPLGTAMLPVKALDTVQPLYGLTAFALLIAFVATGNFQIIWPVLFVMVAKVVIDLAWLLRSIVLYRRWTGHREGLSLPGALLAAALEPVSFQLLRHAGAAWGWWVFLTGRQVWGTNTRAGVPRVS